MESLLKVLNAVISRIPWVSELEHNGARQLLHDAESELAKVLGIENPGVTSPPNADVIPPAPQALEPAGTINYDKLAEAIVKAQAAAQGVELPVTATDGAAPAPVAPAANLPDSVPPPAAPTTGPAPVPFPPAQSSGAVPAASNPADIAPPVPPENVPPLPDGATIAPADFTPPTSPEVSAPGATVPVAPPAS